MSKTLTYLIGILLLISSIKVYGQSSYCDADVPYFLVDLRGAPDSIYTTPDVERNGKCCDAANNSPCVQFEIYLDPGAQAIQFDVCEGAKPSGALYYQVDCGERVAVGDPLCLEGEGPFILTFCKPGKNDNIYCIKSLPRPTAGPDITLQEGCSGTLTSVGFSNENVTWTSIFPGNTGDFDYLLNCTFQCPIVQFNADGILPAYIDYTVCGFNIGGCDPLYVCDTVRVNITDAATIKFNLDSTVLCTDADRKRLRAIIEGGTPPYNIIWSTGETTNEILVGGGTYTLTITDGANCAPITKTIVIDPPNEIALTVNSFPVLCNGENTGQATVNIAGGFPDFEISWNDSLNQSGNTAKNLSAGTYTVTVTDSLGCIASADVVVSEPSDPLVLNIVSQRNVSCKGGSNGFVAYSASGGTRPYSYQLNSDGSTSDTTLSGLSAGVYTVLVRDANGCTSSVLFEITEPEFALDITESITPVACFGDASGKVILTGFGGTPNYTYGTNGVDFALDSVFNGLSAGTYTFYIKDDNGCTDSVIVNITQPQFALTLTSSVVQPKCFGSNDGEIDASISGGTAPYTYQWSNGISQSLNTGLAAGTYQLVVTDANGCKLDTSIALINPPQLILNLGSINTVCANSPTGTAYVNANGGTTPYTFVWDDPLQQKNDTAYNLLAGSYTVNVVDANGCLAQGTIEVKDSPSPLSITVNSITDVACFGDNSGSADVNVVGGALPFTYSIAPNVTTTITETNINNGKRVQIRDLIAGNYTLTVTDANGCIQNIDFTIKQPSKALSAKLFDKQDVKCFGDASGSATVSVTGGTPNYTYQWSSGSAPNGPINNNIPAGNHTVIVEDANGCTDTLSFTIDGAIELDIVSAQKSPVLCFGDNSGVAFATATGGAQPYNYQWNDNFSQTTDTAYFLLAGTYTVIVIDNNGCVDSSKVVITQPLNPLNLALTQKTNVTCFGANNGSASVIASGGTAPYSYEWNDANNQTSRTAINLAAGTYTVTVTDANGCTFNLIVTIDGPSKGLAIKLNVISNVSCFGLSDGQANVTVTGGTMPYSYLYSPNGATTALVNNLSAGLHRVTVTDANGCSSFVDFEITEPISPLEVTAEELESVSCKGFLDGVAQAFADGGTLPYSYVWNDPNNQNGDIATSLAAGTYTVVVTDKNSCKDSATVIINEPAAALRLSLNVSAVKCKNGNDGEATVLTVGGTAPFTYSWNDPLNQKTATAKNLVAGTYDVLVTDKNGCTSIATAVVTEPNQALSLVPDFINPNCSGNSNGQVSVVVSGGTSPYSYQWNDPNNSTSSVVSNLPEGEYEVVVTDANQCVIATSIQISEPNPIDLTVDFVVENCDGADNGIVSVTVTGGTAPYAFRWDDAGGTTSPTATGLAPGNYNVTVIDANGCTGFATVVITATVKITLTLAGEDVKCFGANDGNVITTLEGATLPVSYNWTPIGRNTKDLIDVGPDTYTLNINDGVGCPASAEITIEEPNPFTITSSSADVSCFGFTDGNSEVFVSGANPPYSYSWNDNKAQSTKRASGLSKGNYTVTVTDAKGCSQSENIIVGGPDPIAIALVPDEIKCFGESNASISSTVTGGTPAYQYSWNDANAQSTSTAFNLPKGFYELKVTDANLCIQTATTNINGPESRLTLALEANNVSCKGLNNGSINSFVSGGSSPYQFVWSHNATEIGSSVGSLAPGFYTLVVTDAKGCKVQKTIEISEPNNALDFSVLAIDIGCKGDSNGTAEAFITGGVAPYAIDWKNPINQSTIQVSGLRVGLYSVEVSDKVGCALTKNFEIKEPAQSIDFTLDASSVLCFGNNTGKAFVNSIAGTAPFQYSWNDGFRQKTDTAFNLAAGVYSLTVIDNNGCSKVDSIEIQQPDSALGLTLNPSNVSCNLGSDANLLMQATGGTSAYSFTLNGAVSSSFAENLSAGLYTVLVADRFGCTASKNATITEPKALELEAEVVDIACFNESTGKVTVTVRGGVKPYTYNWSTDASESGNSIDSLSPGNVSLIVTDANGCTINYSVNIQQPNKAVTSTTTSTNALCFGQATGIASVKPIGGTAPYTYVWNDPLQQKRDTIYNLAKGTYTVTIEDANGCVASNMVSVNEPTEISVGINTSILKCFGDSNAFAEAIVNGGIQPYAYQWNDANNQTTQRADGLKRGNYIVNVTDNNQCVSKASVNVDGPAFPITLGVNIGNVKCKGNSDGWAKVNVSGGAMPYQFVWDAPTATNSDSIFGLGSGQYNVTVFDANSCSAQKAFAISEPASDLNLVVTKDNILCYNFTNGAALATVNGGKAPYTYLWNDPNSTTTRKVSSLSPGLYQVIVTDANQCVTSQEVEILAPTQPIAIGFNPINPSCFGSANGQLEAIVSQGKSPYTYKWNVGGTGNTNRLFNLKVGSYYIDVTDANGCRASDTINLTQPNILLAIRNEKDVNCAGLENGQVTFNAQGGTPNYTYILNQSTQNTTGIFTGLPSGLHALEIIDKNGCKYDDEFVITEPKALQFAIDKSDVACNGEKNGGVRILIEGGGTPNYSISFNNGAFVDTTILKATALKAGTYPFIIKDKNGCSINNNVQLIEPNALSASANGSGTFCVGEEVELTATVSGGTPTYTYSWSSSLINNDTILEYPTETTNYFFQGIDANGCKTPPIKLDVNIRNLFDDSVSVLANDTNCFGDKYTVQAVHFKDGQDSDYMYNWSPNIGNNTGPYTFTANNNSINYVLTITDVCGNEVKDSILVIGVKRPEYILPDTVATACVPYNIIIADTINSNTGTLKYSWFVNGTLEETSNVFVRNFNQAGEYNIRVVIETLFGCKTTAANTSKIFINESPTAYAESDKTEDILRDATFNFYNLSNGYTSYYWTFGDGDSSFVMNPTKTYADTGLYNATIHVENNNGCPAEFPIQVRVKPYYILVVPSGFTPSGNQGGEYDPTNTDNDVFYPFTDFVRDYSFKIFNRWGELVFESNNLEIGWDGYYKGKLSQQDVYVWKLNITYTDGFKVSKTGDVTLFRK